jgi:hypothetical protein
VLAGVLGFLAASRNFRRVSGSPSLRPGVEPRWETCQGVARRAPIEPGVSGFGESTAALDQVARSKVAMRRTHGPDLDYDLALRFTRAGRLCCSDPCQAKTLMRVATPRPILSSRRIRSP